MESLNSRLTSLADFQAVQTLLGKAITSEAELESKVRCPLMIMHDSIRQIAVLDESIRQLESNLRAESAAVQSAHETLRVSSEALVTKLFVIVSKPR
jgi:predicted  nucleic acid-binding Zn-ribbon protein